MADLPIIIRAQVKGQGFSWAKDTFSGNQSEYARSICSKAAENWDHIMNHHEYLQHAYAIVPIPNEASVLFLRPFISTVENRTGLGIVGIGLDYDALTELEFRPDILAWDVVSNRDAETGIPLIEPTIPFVEGAFGVRKIKTDIPLIKSHLPSTISAWNSIISLSSSASNDSNLALDLWCCLNIPERMKTVIMTMAYAN